MRCVPAIVLRANITADSGAEQLRWIPGSLAHAVVVREHSGKVLYYVFNAGTLRSYLSTSSQGASVESALALDEYDPVSAGPLTADLPAGSVVVEGLQVLGVLVDAAAGHHGGVIPAGVGDPTFETRTLDGGSRSPEVAVVDDGPKLFRAYPDVRAPGQVGVGEEFLVDVGFSSVPPSNAAAPVENIVVLAPPRPRFVIQVAGFGFTFPDGVEASLIVDRDHPESARVPIKVRSKPDEGAAPRILEVSYEYAGAVVGRTWVQILVVAGAPEQTAEAAVGSAGSPPVLPAGDTPHLSIDVFSRPGDPELQWRFHCKYPDVTRPDDVSKTVNYGSPQAFALQMMQQVPAASSGAFVRQTMAGFGRDVADALPGDFWPIFFETWRLARASGEEPRMLLTTSESWIPWELAWISQDRLPQGVSDLLGPDVGKGATLGQLWQVGRWAMPTQPQPTGPVPASPPASSVDANDMVVIIGKYEGDATVNPLPYAEDEGTTLATEYGGLPLDVSSETIAALMGCEYQRNGSDFRPTVIHFAGHGQTDVNNPQFTGLLLNGGKRLDPAVIRGFDLVSATQPFVFLNACEAGVASETLAHLGGLVGAFLAEGTRAFIAPLWKVDDVEARDIALAFYKSVLVDGMSVGAAMQDIRRRFTAASTSATALAYVFYGNPNLVLKRGVA